MKVGCVNAPIFGATPIRKNSEQNFLLEASNTKQIQNLVSCPTLLYISQIPKINFSSNTNNFLTPDIEIKKYDLSKDVQRHIENEDFLSAIKGKLELAQICKSQKKENDAFYLEESIRILYDGLPKYQKNEAKDAIRKYNYDMALYIDQDVNDDDRF